MEFGICTDVKHAAAVKAAGWDFVEENVQARLKGRVDDAQWTGRAEIAACPLPVPAANCLVPGEMKIVGQDVDAAALHAYMANVTRRAAAVGIKTLVFGSGGARNVPVGFDASAARAQIRDFLRAAAPLAKAAGVTIVIEPLNRRECNIINSVAEAMQYVLTVDHEHVACLVDTYHLWLEDEPVEHVRQAAKAIRHVHVADKNGRVAPGESGESDYAPVFAALKAGGYDGAVSVEANFPDIAGRGKDVLAFLRKEWDKA